MSVYLRLIEAFQDGVVVRPQDDPRRDAAEEPARPQQGHEGAGQGEGQDGAAGEEDHCRHQEDGQAGTDGRSEDHGQSTMNAK